MLRLHRLGNFAHRESEGGQAAGLKEMTPSSESGQSS